MGCGGVVTLASVEGGSCSTSRQSYDARCDRCLNVGTWRRRYQSTEAAFSLPSTFVCWISLRIFCSPSDEQLDQEDLPRNVPRRLFIPRLLARVGVFRNYPYRAGVMESVGSGPLGGVWGRRTRAGALCLFGPGRRSLAAVGSLKLGRYVAQTFRTSLSALKCGRTAPLPLPGGCFVWRQLPAVIRPGKRCIRGASLHRPPPKSTPELEASLVGLFGTLSDAQMV